MSTTDQLAIGIVEKDPSVGATSQFRIASDGAARLIFEWTLPCCVPVIIDETQSERIFFKFSTASPRVQELQAIALETGNVELWIRAQVQRMRERGEKIDNNNHGFCIHPECTKPNKGKPLHIMSRVHHIRQKPAHAGDVRTMTGRKGGKPRSNNSPNNSDNTCVTEPSAG